MQSPTYEVKFTSTYIEELAALAKHGHDVVETIQNEAEGLVKFPEKKGKPLVKELAGLWSRRAYRKRFRIIYSIERTSKIVYVIFVGIRKEGSKKDVYKKMKMIKRKLAKAAK